MEEFNRKLYKLTKQQMNYFQIICEACMAQETMETIHFYIKNYNVHNSNLRLFIPKVQQQGRFCYCAFGTDMYVNVL